MESNTASMGMPLGGRSREKRAVGELGEAEVADRVTSMVERELGDERVRAEHILFTVASRR